MLRVYTHASEGATESAELVTKTHLSLTGAHIVKQSHVRLKKIVANDDEAVLFATKRYDRIFVADANVIDGLPVPRRLHQEDFAQALGIAAYLCV